MGLAVGAKDWSSTPLGTIETWPQSLRSALSICLGSRFPIVIFWASDHVVLYNDAYAEILGRKHPWALGRPCREVWSEIWGVIAPMLDRVLTLGDATWSDDQLLLLERRGYPEECYFSFSFSPVRGANGGIDGIFTAVIENTGRVLGERRLRTLRDLGGSLTEVKSAEEACSIAANALADNRADVPFALFYLADPQSRRGTLVASTGGDNGIAAAPTSFKLDHLEDASAWPLASVCRSGEAAEASAFSSSALVLPLATAAEPHCSGVIAVGVSRHRELDQEYKGFFELIARRVAAAIAEARAYEAERRRAEALAEIDRAKTAFFSNISHEFRTPLTLMLGPLEELKGELGRSGASLSPAQYRQIDLAHRNGLRLLKLVNTLLNFSRIEAGRVQAVYESTDLAVTTAELASVFRSAIEKAGLRLVVDCPAQSEPAYVDREMWEKIVLNLLSNAFKFTFEGEIEVRLRQTNAHFELTVCDTGTGIQVHELPKLFERFHRVAGAHGRTHEGSGIGLALVQELVKLHGGSISVESEHGKGSTFKVAIPRGCGHLPAKQIGAGSTVASTAQRHFVEDALRWLPDAGSQAEQIEETAPEPPDTASVERARVVLADDNADMRDYVQKLLARRYDVEAVADGEAALKAIARVKPDLVLSDIMMPRLDGMQLLVRLRADPETSTLPIILLSARAGEESSVEGMQAGADDYLIKPFSARELLARVEAHVKIARLRRDSEQALRDEQERWNLAAHVGRFGQWHLDLVTNAVDFSASCKANFGLGPEEQASSERIYTLIHPDDREQVTARLRQAMAERNAYEVEYRVIWPDGSLHWINARGTASYAPDGTPLKMVGVTLDITERKRTEEYMRMLVAELDHRVKNTLATVNAVVSHTQQARQSVPDFAAALEGRLRSMAATHELLSAHWWQGVPLSELVRRELAPYAARNNAEVSGPEVVLRAEAGQAMAMVLHELATNAAKYGALSTKNGCVSVQWGRRLNGCPPRLVLEWREIGGPPVVTPGYGTSTIRDLIPYEFGGTVDLVFAPEGVQCRLELPTDWLNRDRQPISPALLARG